MCVINKYQLSYPIIMCLYIYILIIPYYKFSLIILIIMLSDDVGVVVVIVLIASVVPMENLLQYVRNVRLYLLACI